MEGVEGVEGVDVDVGLRKSGNRVGKCSVKKRMSRGVKIGSWNIIGKG